MRSCTVFPHSLLSRATDAPCCPLLRVCCALVAYPVDFLGRLFCPVLWVFSSLTVSRASVEERGRGRQAAPVVPDGGLADCAGAEAEGTTRVRASPFSLGPGSKRRVPPRALPPWDAEEGWFRPTRHPTSSLSQVPCSRGTLARDSPKSPGSCRALRLRWGFGFAFVTGGEHS